MEKLTGLIIVSILLLTSCVSLVSPTRAEEQSRQIISFGRTLYVGGSGPNNYSTIREAINAAINGDTIFVYNESSPYNENVIIEKSITLVGEDPATTIIDGDVVGDVISVHADNATIQGFTIESSRGRSFVGGAVDNISLHNTMIVTEVSGLFLSDSINITVKENIISRNYNGIFMQNCRKTSVMCNSLSFNDNCIVVEDSDISTISDNSIGGGLIHRGIHLSSSNYNSIYGNTIGFTTHYAIGLSGSKDNTIWNNYVHENILYGMYLYSSNENMIVRNNFIRNTQNAWDNGDNIWDGGYPFGGNYWDDYNGTDSNSDGIGDTSYNISGDSNQDHYPLMCPWTGILGDLDGDVDVDLSDLAQLLAHYGTQSGATYWMGDLDGDEDVDLSDLAVLLAWYRTARN